MILVSQKMSVSREAIKILWNSWTWKWCLIIFWTIILAIVGTIFGKCFGPIVYLFIFFFHFQSCFHSASFRTGVSSILFVGWSQSEKLSVNKSPLCGGWYVAILIKMVIPILCAEINGHVPCPYFLPCPIINRVEIIGLISILSFDQSGFSTFFLSLSSFDRRGLAAEAYLPLPHHDTLDCLGPWMGWLYFLKGEVRSSRFKKQRPEWNWKKHFMTKYSNFWN